MAALKRQRRGLQRSNRAMATATAPARTSTDAVEELPTPEPALQVASVDDAEHQDRAVVVDDVVHDAVVADTQPVEGVGSATDGLDRLPRHASRAGHVMRESLECPADAIAVGVTELLELTGRRT